MRYPTTKVLEVMLAMGAAPKKGRFVQSRAIRDEYAQKFPDAHNAKGVVQKLNRMWKDGEVERRPIQCEDGVRSFEYRCMDTKLVHRTANMIRRWSS